MHTAHRLTYIPIGMFSESEAKLAICLSFIIGLKLRVCSSIVLPLCVSLPVGRHVYDGRGHLVPILKLTRCSRL